MRDWRVFVRQHFAGRRPPSDQAIEELAQHVEETYRAARAAGRTDEEALALARTELENPPAALPPNMVAEPGAGVGGFAASLVRDVRYGLRVFTARPGFTAVAIITLALGIGANTAIFSVVRALLLEPLPFPNPDRLVMLWETRGNEAETSIVSAPNYLDWRTRARSLEDTGIWEFLTFNLSGEGEAERVSGIRVSASTFHMLGVAPLIGRTFLTDEDAPGHDVVIISFGLWQSRFGGRPDIIGATTRVNGRPFEIVGVMPASFRFPTKNTAVWTPIAFNEEDKGRGSHSFYAVARLRPGVTFTVAKAEMDTLGRGLAREYPDDNRAESATITPMRDLGVVELKPTLLALASAVALVLTIACLNVANLLLAQSSSRRQEFAIRAALGASRRRLAAQVLCEGLVISIAGGAAGVGVAALGTRVLNGVLPSSIVFAPYRDASAGIHLDLWTLAFTTAIALVTGVLFSLAPIAALRHPNLKTAGDRSLTGRLHAVRSTLVATEVALALVVLVAAGLMIKSLMHLVTVDPGLDPENVLVVSMSLPQPDFYGPPVRQQYCSDVSDRVGNLPGIAAVGATSHLPLSGANAGRGFTVEGFTAPPGQRPSANYRLTCPGYFKTMGIPILRGRDFTTRDATEAAPVAIINEETAKRYWPNADPIGRHIRLNDSDPWITVVGVVGSVRHFGLDDTAHREFFRPYSQAAWPVMSVVVKTNIAPAAALPAVRKTLQTIDPDLPVGAGTTMSAVEETSMGSRRFPMLLLSVFGVVALTLAMVGVYGVVSYVVAQRTREIGIRVALGARRGQVIRLVLWSAMRPVFAGILFGGVGAVFASRLLGSLLFNVKPGDPTVLVAIAALLAGAGAIASLVPGTRATRVDPITVLRVE